LEWQLYLLSFGWLGFALFREGRLGVQPASETRMKKIFVAVGLACSLNCVAASAEPQSAWTPDFTYDTTTPLAIRTVSTRTNGTALVEDITFMASTNTRVKAFLVSPPGQGPFPGILWVHWSGEPGNSSRVQFLSDAVQEADAGFVSLLVDAMWSTQFPWTGSDYAKDRATCVKQVKQFRRAIDLLAADPHVDSRRLGFVGHDFGAMAGAQLAGADPRITSYVLIAGAPRYRYWFFRWSPLSAAARVTYAAEMEPIDPITLLQKSKASLFFQLGTRDEWVPVAEGREYESPTEGRRRVSWYNCGHAMASAPAIRPDRKAWLERTLLHSGEVIEVRPGPEGAAVKYFGDDGLDYDLQQSTNLVQWSHQASVKGSGTVQTLVVAHSEPSPAMFYRLQLEQP
jgi:dienelactone hydrolase